MAAIHTQDLSLIELLLSVNDNADGWQHFIEAFTTHFKMKTSHLMVINNKSLSLRFHISSGESINSEFSTQYITKYIDEDLFLKALKDSPKGRFYARNLMENDREMQESKSTKEWAKPQGIAVSAGACLYSQGDWSFYSYSSRSENQGLFTQEEIDRMTEILPFIEQALKSTLLIQESKQDRLLARAIVNGYRIPVAVFNEYGELWTQNEAMDKLIEEHEHLYIKDNCLHIKSQKQDRLLHASVLQTVKEARKTPLNIVGQSPVIPLDQDINLGFHKLLESDDDTNECFLGAMMYAVSTKPHMVVDYPCLRQLFKLTPAEGTICQKLLQGLSLQDISSTEKKSIYTVREQLKNIFVKTNTNNQMSLINLISGIPVLQSVQ